MTYCIDSIDDKVVNSIVRNYNPLESTKGLTNLLSSIYSENQIKTLPKEELHQLVNGLILKRHGGEQVLKYHLFKAFFKKPVVAAFEMKVNNSRVDFLAVNGDTKSFEIKSKLDNLSKLKKQSQDYLLAFEYNYLVVDPIHLENALSIIPKSFGVWSFTAGGRKKNHREALFNKKIDAEMQLTLLTKRELLQQFANADRKIIAREFSEDIINSQFKLALKSRYGKRWDFLREHQSSILPIDLQFFFNRNIAPEVVYYS